jgi:hypothetical protein
MASQHERAPELRRFLVINFRVGTRDDGYLVGPALVSTRDYKQFHYWDEPSAALLSEDDFEVVKRYPLGLTYDEVTRQFIKDFPPTATTLQPAAGWIAPDGIFYSAAGWVALGRRYVDSA